MITVLITFDGNVYKATDDTHARNLQRRYGGSIITGTIDYINEYLKQHEKDYIV